jgi:hypothetical protein
MLNRIGTLLLALLACAAVIAPATSANSSAPLRDSFELPELELFDLDTTTACGGEWVFANLSGSVDRTLYLDKDGNVDHQIEAFHGRITWFTRGSGKSYSSTIVNRVRIDFPEGTGELFLPVKVTVTGQHGGVFPIGGGPAGVGTLTYDGFWYAQDDAGFTYWATEGAPTSMNGNFHGTTRRICAALT